MVITFLLEGKVYSSEFSNACMSYQKKVIHGKKSVILHYAIIQSEMGLFLSFSVLELQRGYLYLNGVEFLQKVIGAGLFWGHLNYSSGGLQTFPLLSVTWAKAPIAEPTITTKVFF